MTKLRRSMPAALLVVLLLGLLHVPGAEPSTLEYRVFRAAESRAFNPLAYMVESLAPRAGDWLFPPPTVSAALAESDEVATVRRYLSNPRRADPALRDEAERILQRQIAESLADLQIEWSVLGQERVFPPVQFEFTALPDVLIVSRRDRVERISGQTLQPDTTDEQMEAIEAAASAEGVSALVVRIGGLAVYPSMIPPTNSLEWLVPTLAHEWAHQFFSLHPVGWRYALDLERDANMITLNESAAEMIGDEVGWHALERFYGLKRPEPAASPAAAPANPRADAFSRRMRAIRERADALLAAGRIDEAEQLMESEREALNADGYRIRKLNQAYFAFYGSYASSPGFVNPVGDQLKQLRGRSASLRAFIFAVADLNSTGDLRAAIGAR